MERRAAIVRGIVQGVGFRPYVYQLAHEWHLSGCVRNESGTVQIEIEGDGESVDFFCRDLVRRAPPLALINEVVWTPLRCQGDSSFHIAASRGECSSDVLVSPDVATCPACLAELFDPGNRRYRYPFINCTNCGPRLTITCGAPFDRRLTTMAPFRLCAACQKEYEDPLNRRHHAQATCCRDCGPRLQLLSKVGKPIHANDPLQSFAAALQAASIGTLKGIGGYHLVCDASNETAIAKLRQRKQRDDKPLAIMVASIEACEMLCHVSSAERDLLVSPARPIVLLRRKNSPQQHKHRIAASVAPGNPYLGVMLPYAPLHYLLIEAVEFMPLVMTSGNRSNEPIAHDDESALRQLGDIADIFLTHNRAIYIRCDDSVTRVVREAEYPIRRSRGYAPRPIELPVTCPRQLLAIGGQLKATFAIGRGATAMLSHHLGDLDDYRAYQAFEHDIALYEKLFDVHPEVIVHDQHPDYTSNAYVQRRAEVEKISTHAVQHHHAHVAACMAEHGLTGDVIGVAFDGTGFGSDGAIWGGEFLVASYDAFRRAAHLRYVPLPGGDQAIRQPWRSALTHLVDAGCELPQLESTISIAQWQIVRQMIERRINSPLTSSAGRLFDAVAAISGIRTCTTFEGQAAMELEWLATEEHPQEGYPFSVVRPASGTPSGCYEIDTRPLIRAVVDDVHRKTDPKRIARRFQSAIIDFIADVCARIRKETQLNRVVLSGGVFMNVLLTREAVERLTADGFNTFQHRLAPPNDGGISLGQLAVAAAQLHRPVFAAPGNRIDSSLVTMQ